MRTIVDTRDTHRVKLVHLHRGAQRSTLVLGNPWSSHHLPPQGLAVQRCRREAEAVEIDHQGEELGMRAAVAYACVDRHALVALRDRTVPVGGEERWLHDRIGERVGVAEAFWEGEVHPGTRLLLGDGRRVPLTGRDDDMSVYRGVAEVEHGLPEDLDPDVVVGEACREDSARGVDFTRHATHMLKGVCRR